MTRADLPATVRVQQLGPDGWETLRALRLATLEDSPEAFRSTLADALVATEADWRARLDERTIFAAYLDGRPAGLVATHVPASRPQQAELTSMWVSREARGHGVADALMAAACGWARGHGLPRVGLWVMTDNATAQRFYARCGFVRATEVTPDPADPCADQTRMVLDLATVT